MLVGKGLCAAALVCGLVAGLSQSAGAQSAALKASFSFGYSLDAEQAGVPALVPIDPLGLSGFDTAFVYGRLRTVYAFRGDPWSDWFEDPPGSHNWVEVPYNAGLTLDTLALLPADNYSIELVFAFDQDFNEWRKLVDVGNRLRDDGFYTSFPYGYGGGLQVWPFSGNTGPTPFTTGEFHHVVLTLNSLGELRAYLDGALEVEIANTWGLMNIDSPGLLHFFVDDATTGFREFANGRVALIRVYEGALTAGEVASLAMQPFETVPVSIDVKPGSDPNSIRLGTGGNVPVAIFSTFEFDALTVNPSTVSLAGSEVNLRGNGDPQADIEDVNGDGLPDLVVHVSTQALQLSLDDTVAVLNGSTYDGRSIVGSDLVRIVN